MYYKLNNAKKVLTHYLTCIFINIWILFTKRIDVNIVSNLSGPPGPPGPMGLKGDTGKSAFDLWKEYNGGTLDDFQTILKSIDLPKLNEKK